MHAARRPPTDRPRLTVAGGPTTAYAAIAGRSLSFLLLAAVAAYVVVVRLHDCANGLPAHDVYVEYYPNLRYALARVRDGGRGLLWNPLQNCGQPFFAMADVGLLYPANVLFLLLPSHL